MGTRERTHPVARLQRMQLSSR